MPLIEKVLEDINIQLEKLSLDPKNKSKEKPPESSKLNNSLNINTLSKKNDSSSDISEIGDNFRKKSNLQINKLKFPPTIIQDLHL